MTTRVLRFAPLDLGRWLVWGGTAAVLLAAPHLFTQGFALTLMSQMGIMVIFALSYNMLLGQSGMLSFGHAVYSGLGAYFAVHALNLIGKGALALPVAALPLVGGVFGALFGVIFGWVTTRKSGTTFAMISLGIGELVAACSLMLPGFFGGEGGVTANRTAGPPFLGLTFGPAIQVYYLIAVWTFASMAAMFALTRTPLGRIANAVRDNPERAEFIGYDTQTVRFLQLVLSAFFAGVAGGLSAINFEIVTAENVGVMRSGRRAARDVHRRRRVLLRPGHRRDRVHVLHRLDRERDEGLAAVPRALLRRHGAVRPGRHREPDRREPARRRGPGC